MKPTRPLLLIAVFVAAGVLAYLIVRSAYDRFPALPFGPVVTVLVLALIELVAASTTRNRLRGNGLVKPIDPLGVARFAALARASSLLGAAVAGAWCGILGYLLSLTGDGDAIDHDRRVAIAGIVTAAALVGAALWLEWVCRIKRPPGEQHADGHYSA